MNEFRTLWPGGPLYKGESFGTDSLILGDFAGRKKALRCCDGGCGCGILLLLLGAEFPSAELWGVEKRPEAAELCRENLRAGGLEGRSRVLTGDFCGALLPAGYFDLAVSNPPYFHADPSPHRDRAAMRQESVSPEEWCLAGARILKNGGEFCTVYPAQRLAELLSALREAGLEPKELRFFSYRPEAEPKLFLCRARKGGNPGLRVLPPLFQTDGRGRETPEYRKICHWEAL